jgi:hypothetical protein
MGVVERSSANVESCIAMLEESYRSFSVNQTSIAVSSAQYEQVKSEAREDRIDLYAKVENSNNEVLHIVTGDTVTLPSTTTSGGRPLEQAVCETVTDQTGIECSVTGVDRATILGISGSQDEETIYRLAVLFEARHVAGSANQNAVWQQTTTAPQPIEA